MNTEHEVRVLEINIDSITNKLKELNASLVYEGMQERRVYDFNPVNPNRWIRLRTDGKKTTLTIKDISEKSIDGTKELEVIVDDFNKMNSILEELGYKSRGFQQNYRIRYMLDNVEIDIDHWPLIPAYMEIEGSTNEDVIKTLNKLGFKEEDMTTLDVTSIYKNYGYDILNMPVLNFEMEEKK